MAVLPSFSHAIDCHVCRIQSSATLALLVFSAHLESVISSFMLVTFFWTIAKEIKKANRSKSTIIAFFKIFVISRS